MKVCSKCGAQQTDKYVFCIDCGEKLGKAVSQREEAEIKEKTEKNLERLYNKSDPLYVSISDKITGVLAVAAAIVAVILLAVFKSKSPSVGEMGIIDVVLFLFCSVTALFPQILWELEKMRLSIIINEAEDATPSDFYFFTRRAVTYGGLILGVILLVLIMICC